MASFGDAAADPWHGFLPVALAAGVGGSVVGFILSRLLNPQTGTTGNKGAAAAAVSADRETFADAGGESKMVLCVRTDLKMQKGKTGAQIGHAVLGGYKRAMKRNPDAVKEWERSGQAKVAVKVNSEDELLAMAAAAEEKGLNTYIVADAGRTQIASGSLTVLCIGPDTVRRVNSVTGSLKLL